MKKMILVILPAAVLVFSLASVVYVECGICGSSGKPSGQETSGAAASKAVNIGNKICPVSDNPIKESMKTTVEYNGTVYNLCCPACVEPFKKDPAKYIGKVNEEIATSSEATE